MTALYHFLSLLRVSFYTQPVCAKAAEVGARLANLYLGKIGHLIKTGRELRTEQARAREPRFDLYIYEMISTQAAQKGGREAKTFLITEAAKAATRLLCIPHHESNTPRRRRRPNNECKQSQSS
jgi:hypothetical protein